MTFTFCLSWNALAPDVDRKWDPEAKEWIEGERRTVPWGRVESHPTWDGALTAKKWHEANVAHWLPVDGSEPVVSDILERKERPVTEQRGRAA